MRHRVKTVKLKRKTAHRRSLLANLSCSLIEHGRIRTTVAKAKALRPIAERMVSLGKRGDLHARRQALAFLRQKDAVKKLFDEVAPAAASRRGGYCRITKLGPRPSDAAPMAFIEWVDMPGIFSEDEETAAESATTPAAKEETPAETTEEPAAQESEDPAASEEESETKDEEKS